ncbi:MAG: hypothetical protein WC736_15055 [Gallionella sp.]|jgi:hypothetical protein
MSEAMAAAVEAAQVRDWITLAIFLIVMGLVVALVARNLIRRDQDDRSRFSFDDLLIDPVTKITDPARCVLVGGFAVASLVLVYLAVKGQMSDTVYIAYMAGIVIPAVSVVLKTKVTLPGVLSPSAMTTTKTTTETTTGEGP